MRVNKQEFSSSNNVKDRDSTSIADTIFKC